MDKLAYNIRHSSQFSQLELVLSVFSNDVKFHKWQQAKMEKIYFTDFIYELFHGFSPIGAKDEPVKTLLSVVVKNRADRSKLL